MRAYRARKRVEAGLPPTPERKEPKRDRRLYMQRYRADRQESEGLPPMPEPKKPQRDRAAYMAQYRADRRPVEVVEEAPKMPSDPAEAVARWSAECLRVPPGHRREGEPMILPSFGVEFLRGCFRPGVREGLLCIARKNAKSAIIAVWLLAHLAGPLRRFGWRAGVASVSKAKAGELKRQCQEIAEASGLTGIRFLRSPAPGRIESVFGSVDVLAAEGTAGAASGFDLSLIDEIGLLREKDRALVAGMRSSISARDGKFVSLSVYGSGPFVPEILARRGDPALAVHLYAADLKTELGDESAWRAANPALDCGIKSLTYMRDEARRVATTTSDQASFRALDLNQPLNPVATMLVSLDDFVACETVELPERRGACYLGVDLGGSASMTAACAFWPESGRVETWAAFPATPSLAERGLSDGVGKLYVEAQERGELMTFAGRVTPVALFLAAVVDALKGADVQAVGCDRFRRAEAVTAYESAGVVWPCVWRGVGASAKADGSFDVRAFQRAVIERRVSMLPSVLFPSAIAAATVRTDVAGNPALAKAAPDSRIDLAQAAVIALGLAAYRGPRSKPRAVQLVVAG